MPGRISLAGRIVVTVEGQHVDERGLGGGQTQLALALLVAERNRPVTRDELADNLWPQARPQSWAVALRGVVGRVRAFLVDAGLGDASVVRGAGGVYHVALPDDVEVDVERAVADTSAAETALVAGEPATAAALADRARAVLVRPLLPGIEAPWLDHTRRTLEEALLRSLECLAEARLALGEPKHAVTAATEAVRLDAFRESAHRLVVRAHLDAGDVGAGLQAYERCRQLLRAELGTDPAPKTQALHAALLHATAAATTPAPALAAAAPPGAAAARLAADVCPYRGLQAFDEADADVFFGRDADLARMLDRLEGRRFLAVVGPSGSGKSSLVRAGLVPALRRGALPGSDTWVARVLRPGAVPVKALARELTELDPSLETAPTERQLLEDAHALHRLAAAALRPPANLVLVVDQLEEAFTLCDDAAQRQAFFDLLAVAATTAGSRVVVVVTVRADFYPRLVEHARTADLASAHQFLVTPMDAVGLARAIGAPARAVGLALDDGLTETILRDVAGRPGSLPLLGHCLLELWEHRTGGRLTLAAYDAVGGVTGALAQRADAVYLGFDAEQRAVARRVLLRLIQPGETTDDTRRRVAFAELPRDPAEAPLVEAVVERLVEARLVTSGGPPAQGRWVEVSHEALVRGWPRLHRWVEEDRAGLRLHRRITAAAREWDRLGRDPGALYRGAQLAEAAAWAERHRDAMNPLERAFVDAGVADEDAGQRRRQRRVRLGAAVLAVGMALVVGLGATATVQRTRAEEQQRLALSRAVAAEAVNRLAVNPAHGLALAVEAVEIAPTREAVAALRQALVTPHPRLEVPGGRRDFAVDPAGAQLAVGGEDGTVEVWDLATGALAHTLGGHAGPISAVEFSPDGHRLVTTDEDGARVWVAADGALAHVLPHEAGAVSVAWDADSRRLLTAGFADTIRVWDADSGSPEAAIQAPAAVSFVELSPDGGSVLAWSATDPELYLLGVPDGRQLAVLEGHEAAAVDARLSPDGRHAVSVGVDGTARLWELSAGTEVATLDGFDERVWVGRFSPDGSLAVVGDARGAVRVTAVPSGETVFEHTAHADAVVDAAFGPDGATLVTVSLDGTALVWDVAAGEPRDVLQLNGAAGLGIEARSVAFTPDGTHVLTRAATVQLWEVPPGPRVLLRGHERHVASLAFSPDGALLATGGIDGTLRLWDVDRGETVQALELAGSSVSAASFSGDGAHLVTANPYPAAVTAETLPPTIWEVATGRQAGALPVVASSGPPCPQVCQIGAVRHSPDGALLATAGQDGVVRLWDAESSTEVRALEPVDRSVRSITFSPDGRTIAGAAWHRAALWDVASGALRHDLPAPGMAVAFAPDGDLLAVGGDDGIASLWDPATGRSTGALPHASTVVDVAWSPDGRFLLTAAGDGAHLWDVAAEQRLQAFTGHGGAQAVAFAPDGAIVVAAADGAVAFHDCAVCASVDELLDVARQRVLPAAAARS